MAPARRHRIGASRRRREDEGEDEGSTVGHVEEEEEEDDSMSDGSLPSHLGDDDDDADGEGSDLGEDESSVAQHGSGSKRNGHTRGNENGAKKNTSPASGGGEKLNAPFKPTLTTTVSDTEAMMNGLKLSDATGQTTEEIEFDKLHRGEDKIGRTPSAPPTGSGRETFAERKRREHEEYVKARDEDPAFVPTRGGFFLHDKRSTEGSNGHRSANNKSKSRPYGLIVDGNVGRRPKPEASDGQWTHDLHDTVLRDDRPNSSTFTPPSYSHHNNSNAGFTNGSATVSMAPRSSPPNRSFSTTLLIGNVPVRVFLPGMENSIPFAAVPKRQHTRLPQHRPPLRRDKPVRVSLPGISPKYILPAPERSFIFIPRALRPNQQSFRGRGRGGGYYHTGRRPSFYQPGSTYSPSLSMSRRSSLREGMHSPAASVLSRQNMPTGEKKPIVRLPPAVRPPGAIVPGGPVLPIMPVLPPLGPNMAYRESRGGPITMHQPRPQKTVSVADIESPASFNFNPPQPQQEQPFHHQVPVAMAPGYGSDGGYAIHGRHPSHPSQTSGTPLSHIPERAIHAAPFQPYGVPPQPTYYAGGYPPGTVYYPGTEYPHYTPPAGNNAVAYGPPPPQAGPHTGGQPYILHPAPPPPPPPPAPQQATGDQQGPQHAGTVAHEANGTVYFYDAQELYHPNAPYNATGGVLGMGGMMTPPGTTYYYPQSSGVYYPSQ